EERYLQELRGLRESIMQSIRPAETSLDAESIRLELPTPAPKVSTRQRPAYIQDSPNVTATREPTHWADPKMPSFQQGEDIENYLRQFKRLARTWSYRLVPLLTGQALEAYLAMDEERSEVYTDLKEALLEKFNISPETYRQRFRSTTVPAGESPTETYKRLKNLYKRWVRPEEHSKEEIGEAIILEQLLWVLPYDAHTWVREHEPRSGLAVAKLAQQYLNAHCSSPCTQPLKGTVRGVSHNSGSKVNDQRLALLLLPAAGPQTSCVFRKNVYDVTVNGHELKALLDIGSSLSMVKSCFVNNVNYVNATSFQCVHGDIKQYPRAEVMVEVHKQMYLLNVAVVDNLLADMILGRDLPVLYELLQPTIKDSEHSLATATVDVSCPALTRAQARAGLQPLPDLDSSLLQGGTKGPKKSRRQRWLEKYLGTPASEASVEGLEVNGWKVPGNIAQLQREDDTLKPLFVKAECEKHQICAMKKSKRKLRRARALAPIMYTFYRGTIESILTSCITVWFGACNASCQKTLQRIVKAAERIIGVPLPSLQVIYSTRLTKKAICIAADPSHPMQSFFSLLPSGRRLRSLQARTSRLKDSFFHQAVRKLNCLPALPPLPSPAPRYS
ncbi:hypothetical protein M9458_008308, partial [Cirrhinus mrigala]